MSVIGLFGAGGAVSASRWRLLFPNGRYMAPQGDRIGLSELEFYAPNGSTNIATGGTATAFDWESANTPAEAFDGIKNLDGWFHLNNAIGSWLEYDFGTDVEIGDFKIWFLQDFNNAGDIDLQYFDGTSWVTERSYVGLTPATSAVITFHEDGTTTTA